MLNALLLCGTCCCAAHCAIVPSDPLAMSVKVEAGDYVVRGNKVTVASNAELPIEPPTMVRIVGEPYVMVDDTSAPTKWPPHLPGMLGPIDTFSPLSGCLKEGSVRAYASGPDGAAVSYQEGKDYRLEAVWGRLWRNPGGTIPSDGKVLVDYAIYRQRIDTLEVTGKGEARIRQGSPVQICPQAPVPHRGATAIASVYVRFGATRIAQEDIFPVPQRDSTWRDAIRVKGREHLSRTLGLLRRGKPVNVVCWGDSVTQGYSASIKSKCFASLLEQRLRQAYPKSTITVTNTGIAGSGTDSRRDGFEKEVLSLKPDLITVEFVNDAGLPPDRIAANYSEFIKRARQKLPDVEFIILTPHYVARQFLVDAFFPSVEAMRKAAVDNGVALGDTTHIWDELRNLGIPFDALIANSINHPNDLGHEFYAETLMNLLGPG